MACLPSTWEVTMCNIPIVVFVTRLRFKNYVGFRVQGGCIVEGFNVWFVGFL